VFAGMILDATCGYKEMWFNKQPEKTIFIDIRKGAIEYKGPKGFSKFIGNINPNILASFFYLPFKDNIFDLVVFDPPHVIGKKPYGVIQFKYGVLSNLRWQNNLYTASREIWRVLKPGGFLVFKWAESSRSLSRVLPLFPSKPLFGSTGGQNQVATWWVIFQKEKQK